MATFMMGTILYLPSIGFWVTYLLEFWLSFLISFGFLICKMGSVRITISEAVCEDSVE